MYPHKLEANIQYPVLWRTELIKDMMKLLILFYMMLCLAAFLFQTFSLIWEYHKNPTARRTALKEILHNMTCIIYSTFSILGYFCSIISPRNILPRWGPSLQPHQPWAARLQGCASLRVGQEVRPRPGQRLGHGEEDSRGGVRGRLQPASAGDLPPQWFLLETEREPVQPRPGLARLSHELRGRQVRASNKGSHKVRNHGKGPFWGLLLVESYYKHFHI